MSEPIFKPIFGPSWETLPPVMHKHYANKPYSNDTVTLQGAMTIKTSRLMKLFSPFLALFGALVPYSGENIPTTVYSISEPNSDRYILERHFNFPTRKKFIFRSALTPVGGNEVVEIMRFGIGWRCRISYDGSKVLLLHKSFALKLFGIFIPLPLALLLGRGYAEEESIDENNFRMKMTIIHPIFGQVYEYSGQFKVTDVVA